MAELYSCKDSTNLQNKGDKIIVYIPRVLALLEFTPTMDTKLCGDSSEPPENERTVSHQ